MTHTWSVGYGFEPPVTLYRNLLLLLLLIAAGPLRAELPGGDALWFTQVPRKPAVTLYFFWSSRCPHCQEARPVVEELAGRFQWIELASYELFEHPENRSRFAQMADLLGEEARSVPTFIWCGRMHVGYDGPQTTGARLLSGLSHCYRRAYGTWPADYQPADSAEIPATTIDLPGMGALDVSGYSIATLAVLLGALDAVNPCAFFVLLFLLSLLVNTRSRSRMLLVGGIFVLVSGLVYFAFMAAWLNLFQVLGGITAITLVAGLIATAMGLLNVKDYFRLAEGVSLSLTETERSRLFTRMRGLLSARRGPALLLGTVSLAVAANVYELLCTVGLPMVFTRLLTLENLPGWQYYAYLGLYNGVYILPLAVIVGLFVASMGRRKLREHEGRFLKLLSGAMMTGLGLMLVLVPERLSNPATAVALIGLAVLISLIVHRRFGSGSRR